MGPHVGDPMLFGVGFAHGSGLRTGPRGLWPCPPAVVALSTVGEVLENFLGPDGSQLAPNNRTGPY